MNKQLPVFEVLPRLLEAAKQNRIILSAPPGSGKTTVVPLAFQRHLGGKVLVLEPRRVAARSAAAFMAWKRKELDDEIALCMQNCPPLEAFGRDEKCLRRESEGGLGRESEGGLGRESEGGLGRESEGGLGRESERDLGRESERDLGQESGGCLGREFGRNFRGESGKDFPWEPEKSLGVEPSKAFRGESERDLGRESGGSLGRESERDFRGESGKDFGREPGGQIGYSVRLESKTSAETVVEFITEGILTRRLLADPELSGISAVIFDEFHERSLQADLGLALCLEVQEALRPDLRILVMSATLEEKELQEFLAPCVLVESAGQSFPVAIRYDSQEKSRSNGFLSSRQLDSRRMADAILELMRTETGSLLAFLPGTADIRRCSELLSGKSMTAAGKPVNVSGNAKTVSMSDRAKAAIATNTMTAAGKPVKASGNAKAAGMPDRAKAVLAANTVNIESVNALAANTVTAAGKPVNVSGKPVAAEPMTAAGKPMTAGLTDTQLRIPALANCLLYPLYGDLSLQEQMKAVQAAPEGMRKVVLATDIAESSLTLDGVRLVVDSGLTKNNRYDPAIDMNRLKRERISAASARQRAGRAGRQEQGICLRLWQEGEYLTSAARPEILDTDLSPLLLDILNWGSQPETLHFLTPPPKAALLRAMYTLKELEAINSPDLAEFSAEIVSSEGFQSENSTGTNTQTENSAANSTENSAKNAAANSVKNAAANSTEKNTASNLDIQLAAKRSSEECSCADKKQFLECGQSSEREGRSVLPRLTLTAHGRALAALPLHPRLAHMLLCAVQRNSLVLGAKLAALLSDRDFMPGQADIRLRLSRMPASVSRLAKQIENLVLKNCRQPKQVQASAVSAGSDAFPENEAGILLSLAFPSRIAMRRAPGSFRMASGRGALLPLEDSLANEPFLSIAQLDFGTEKIFLAAPLDKDALLCHEKSIREQEFTRWENGAVLSVKRRMLGALILEECKSAPSEEAVQNLVLNYIRKEGLSVLPWTDSLKNWRQRLLFLCRNSALSDSEINSPMSTQSNSEAKLPNSEIKSPDSGTKDSPANSSSVAGFASGKRAFSADSSLVSGLVSGKRDFPAVSSSVVGFASGKRDFSGDISHFSENSLPDFSDAGLLASLEDWLAPYLSGVFRQEHLKKIPLAEALKSRLTYAQRGELNRRAPEKIRVPSGSEITVDYSQPIPVLAVKLQELFGLAESPRVDGVPLCIHLLSPAGRPLQVTSDLAGFWKSSYFAVRAEMRGRYPKHPWPEDPLSAIATKKTKKALGMP